MTRIEAAAADYANAHRAWAVNTGQTFNIEAATAFHPAQTAEGAGEVCGQCNGTGIFPTADGLGHYCCGHPKAQPTAPSQSGDPTNAQVAALSKALRQAGGITTTAGVLMEAARAMIAATSAQPPQASEVREAGQAVIDQIAYHEGEGGRRSYGLKSGFGGAFQSLRAVLSRPVRQAKHGDLHTLMMDAIRGDVQRQHPEAFTEDNDFELIIQAGPERPAYVKIDVSELAEAILPHVPPSDLAALAPSDGENGRLRAAAKALIAAEDEAMARLADAVIPYQATPEMDALRAALSGEAS